MKVALFTLGCRVNQAESAVIEGTLRANGCTIVDLHENPDYCIVNTCTVTSHSDYNSRQLIRRASRAGAKVIVTGCYSQLKPSEIQELGGVEKIVDIGNKYQIIELLTGEKTEIEYGVNSRSRPYLKVQDGCDYRCSYCSVPLARGRSRSIPMDKVITQALAIESKGFNEIVLTGIHLGSYGRDLPEKSNLNMLIKNLLLSTSIRRIRLSSLEVNEIDNELIDHLQGERLCKHLHIPLQSGCEKILKLMRRNYDAAGIAEKIELIASRIDNIAIGTDVIVGFPGETTEDFETTYDVIRRLPFSYLHIFPFSVRPGTAAEAMQNKVGQSVIKGRADRLSELGRAKKAAYLEKQVGRTLDIVLEERPDEKTISGTSSNYLKVMVSSADYRKGNVVIVRPERVENNHLRGMLIQ